MVSGSYNVNEAFDGDNGKEEKSSNNVTAVTIDKGKEGDDHRGQWSNQCDFFLSALGYAVGLGNVWRFPKLAYDHGGGSFLIPYSCMLVGAGLPLFFMELSLGQFSGVGPTRLFGRLAPITKGLGFAMIIVTFYVAIYYNVIIAWSIYYMIAGFNSELPWVGCEHEYNTDRCLDDRLDNSTSKTQIRSNDSVTAPQEYFNSVVLGFDSRHHGWDNFGQMQWHLVLCLFSAWVIVCLSLIKGVQSSGKVVYFTALFPYAVLIILFGYGLSLPGAFDGIKFYVTPVYSKLREAKVWQDAATQIFFSLGPAFGGLITLASYNRFDNNCHRDAVLIAFSNCATSVFAGFVVFSIVGFMAHSSGLPIDKVVEKGPALAFVVFPDAVSNMAVPQLWSTLFFFMLITLGLDSMFTNVETLTTALLDHFKTLQKHKEMVVVGTCAVGFLLGLSMCFSAGVYMFTLIDGTCASWNILLFAFLEVTTVAWLYGVDRFFGDIRQMGMRLPSIIKWYWKICWLFITPLILGVLVVWKFVETADVSYGDKVFPPCIQGLGWLISTSSVVLLPLLGLRQVIKREREGKPLGKALFRPTPKWMPAVPGKNPLQ